MAADAVKIGVELDRPFEVIEIKEDSFNFVLNAITVSLKRVEFSFKRNNGNKSSDTAFMMHGSSPLINAFDNKILLL